MPQPPRLLLLMPHLGGGGAERVMAQLAVHLPAATYDLHLALVTASDAGAVILPPHVKLHCLGLRRVRSAALPLLDLIWNLRPAVILSGMAHLNLLVLALRPLFPRGTSVLVRQTGTASAHLADGGLPRGTRLLYRRLYPKADRVLCQSGAMARDLTQIAPIPAARIALLPNPVDLGAIRRHGSGTAALPGHQLLAVGRLSPEKGFDILLDAFALLSGRFPAATLTILGEGRERAALQAQAARLKLEQRVHFSGHVADPAARFPSASLFVLSSRHEGLPNALLEAAAAGLPIVATPASGGLVELLGGQPGVWITPHTTASSLAETLTLALDALGPRQRFPHPWIEPYALHTAVDDWQRAITAVLPKECA